MSMVALCLFSTGDVPRNTRDNTCQINVKYLCAATNICKYFIENSNRSY